MVRALQEELVETYQGQVALTMELEGLKAGALQNAIFNSTNFSSIATDAKGVIQIFNVGAERMLGYTADDVMNKITPADISDPHEVIGNSRDMILNSSKKTTLGVEVCAPRLCSALVSAPFINFSMCIVQFFYRQPFRSVLRQAAVATHP